MQDGQRCHFQVDDGGPRPRLARLACAWAVGAAAAMLPACAIVADLAQLDGYTAADAPPPVEEMRGDASGDETTDAADGPTDAGGDGADLADAGPCSSMWPEGGMNVITNPDFEEGGTGWAPLYGGNFTTTTDMPFCGGTFSGELSNRNAFFNALSTNIPPDPGTYTIAVWVRHDGATALPMDVGGLCTQPDGGVNYPPGPTVTVEPNTWTFISGSLAVPDGCTTMQFFVGQPTNAVAPFPDLFADDVYVGL